MRTTVELSPLFRASVGFDRIFDMLEDATRLSSADSWPPYDIAKTGENDYRVTMAVAGYAESELSITQEGNLLFVSGEKAEQDNTQYLHRGIGGRSFHRRFELADHVKVTTASLDHGLLVIDLVREIPEEKKPRQIVVGGAKAPAQIENDPKAA